MDLKDLAPAIVIILLAGLLLGIGIFVMSEVRDNVALPQTGADNNINLTLANGTTTLTDSTKDDYSVAALTVINLTGATIPSTYYSFTSVGVVTWEEALYNGSTDYYSTGTADVNATSTYIYDRTDSAEEGIGNAMDGLAGFSSWFAVIAVVIACAIVLGIVLRSFGGGQKV